MSVRMVEREYGGVLKLGGRRLVAGYDLAEAEAWVQLPPTAFHWNGTFQAEEVRLEE